MMLEKGIADQYEENVIGMLGKGEQKSWSECCSNYELRHMLIF